VFGVPTTNLAFWISVGAAVVAIVSALTAVQTYRRAGSRISVDIQTGRLLRPTVLGPELGDAVIVTVMNSGLAAATVRNVFWRHKSSRLGRWNKDGFTPAPNEMADWPKKVEGNSEETFAYDRLALDSNLALPDKPVAIRAQVTLAGGKTHYSKTLHLEPKDLAVSSREAKD
jgi:hypothetical protein